MIKEKQREKKKNGTPSGSGLENNGAQTSGSNPENRDELKKEHTMGDKGPEVKEEPEEALPELRDNISAHNSPCDEVKASPSQQTEKEVGTLLQNTGVSCKGLKAENGEGSDSNFRNDSCEGVMPMGLPSETIHDGVQPLPSNVINKQPVTMEAQYMQQQSQIFVFSTALANKAAEAVLQGQYGTIIAYHCAQPRTKKYLEGNGHQGPIMQPQCGNNLSMEQNTPKSSHTNHPSMMQSSNSILPDSMMPSLGDFSQDIGLSSHQPLTGVKVPDEDLTPQQRQHREEQLATLRKMQQILFPEALPGPSEGGSGHLDEVIMPENIDMNKPPVTQSDWHKLQLQFYEEQKIKKNRTTGPPPSYQQATRSASVPVALPSPNPSSPNNTTSNLSLPSPRTCSGINSPADKVNPRIPGPSPTMDSPNPARSTNSNPSTPVSIHLSPKHKDKLSTTNEFSPSSTVSAPNSQQSPVDSMYCRSVQSMGQQKPGSNNPGKEPNLMPVPSPQQIQYLNAFEGQELTIQKQPNTSLKETGRKSPVIPPSNLEGVLPSGNNEMPAKVPASPAPSTPDVPSRGNFTSDTPSESSNDKSVPQSQRKMETTFCNSPQANERCHMNIPANYIQKGAPGYLENSSSKCSNINEKDISNGNYQCMGPDNVPLNPNGMNRMNVSSANKSSHFDPISSLAQMSQQLTNNVPNSPVNQPPMIPNMHQNMVPFNSPTSANPHLMPMTELHHIPNTPPDHRMQNQMQQHFTTNNRVQCNNNIAPNISVSPKLMQGYGVPQRPMPRGMNYNGASVQVKPNAPNTIQYLPSRPQSNNGPRGPPSLEFLQRFSNPLSNLDAKVPTHNLQYFPNNYPQNNMNDMSICSPHGNIRGPIRGASPGMMRLQSPQMPPMGFNNSDMFPNTNCQMFVPPTKNTTMGMAPDASQPLPPSMGQSNNFKNSTFIGPTTADPNYAQQFHNFQQQLYATNTRGQLSSQGMANNQHYFMPK